MVPIYRPLRVQVRDAGIPLETLFWFQSGTFHVLLRVVRYLATDIRMSAHSREYSINGAMLQNKRVQKYVYVVHI